MKCSGIVAQLVRASPCHGEGRGFESRRFRHRKTPEVSGVFLCLKIGTELRRGLKAAEGATDVTVTIVG